MKESMLLLRVLAITTHMRQPAAPDGWPIVHSPHLRGQEKHSYAGCSSKPPALLCHGQAGKRGALA